MKVLDLGLCRYREAWATQQERHARAVADPRDSTLILVEHPRVLTFGKNANESHLLSSELQLANLGVEVVKTERGGEVTAHEPGQLVAYPIVSLVDLRLSAKSYVNLLEDAIIETLRKFGIESARDPHYPGVWVGDEKICAIGVRIKQRATMHGLALNVNNNLDTFGLILPCGIAGRGVTSLKRLLGHDVEMSTVKRTLTSAILKSLQIREDKRDDWVGLQSGM